MANNRGGVRESGQPPRLARSNTPFICSGRWIGCYEALGQVAPPAPLLAALTKNNVQVSVPVLDCFFLNSGVQAWTANRQGHYFQWRAGINLVWYFPMFLVVIAQLKLARGSVFLSQQLDQ